MFQTLRFLMVITIALTALALAGCTAASDGQAAMPPAPMPTAQVQPTATETGPVTLTIAVNGREGDRAGLADAIDQEGDAGLPEMTVEMKATSSIMENWQLLLKRNVDLIVGTDYQVVLANQGALARAFPDAPPETLQIKCGAEMVRPAFPEYGENVRIVMPLYEVPLLLIASGAGEITTPDDLRGKRISVGPVDSFSRELAMYVLAGLGIDPETDLSLHYLPNDEVMPAFENGEIDGFFWSGQTPDAMISDWFAGAEQPPVLISIGEEAAGRIMAANPNVFHRSSLAAEGYAGINADVDTLAVTLVVAALADVPADQITQLVSTYFDDDANFAEPSRERFASSMSLLSAEAHTYLHAGLAAYAQNN